MSLNKFNKVKISGISVVVPENEINIYDEAEYYDNSIKKIDRMRKMVGFWKRRVANKEQTALDFAYNAAINLIEEMKIDVNTIDALLYVVQKPDWLGPVNSYFLHHKLGLSKECIATDIVQGCAGWVFGLYIASQMIESGAHKKILLLNGDTPSIGIDPSDRNQAPIFGDAGSATLLEYTDQTQPSHFNIDTIGEGYDAIISPFSANRFGLNFLKDEDFEKLSILRKEKATLPTGNTQPLLGSYIDGLKVFDFTIKQVPKTIKTLLEYANTSQSDINLLALHQANKQIVQGVGTEAGFDLAKVPYEAFEMYGNNTMCSIPTVLSMLDKDIKKENVCCCGFGNGLISAAAILNLSDTYLGEIKTFKKPEYVWANTDEYIDYWRKKMQGQV
ncbi:hypothetical protein J6R97_05765 [bacterium]|nr:hypothetical protein [bacterium]